MSVVVNGSEGNENLHMADRLWSRMKNGRWSYISSQPLPRSLSEEGVILKWSQVSSGAVSMACHSAAPEWLCLVTWGQGVPLGESGTESLTFIAGNEKLTLKSLPKLKS